jgi:hypothetical protein
MVKTGFLKEEAFELGLLSCGFLQAGKGRNDALG